MTRRAALSATALALFLTACAAPTEPPVDFGSGERFVPAVADTLDDVGQGAAVAVGADGTAYVSYFGYPAELAEGKIAVARPIGSPFLPGVLLTSVAPDGLITKGAVQQTKPDVEPPGILVPFRPETVENLDLSTDNANGSSVAVAEDGSVHVAWTAGGGVFHAKVTKDADAVVSSVYGFSASIVRAGPIGRPAIAVDPSGQPWITFGLNAGGAASQVVATPAGDGWDVQDVAPLTRCNGCPQPLPSAIALVGDAPTVVFADPGTNEVLAGTLAGKTWSISTVESGVVGAGLSFASNGETASAAYYDGNGAVKAAAFDGASWAPAKVADSADPEATNGLAAPNTGVAVAPDGGVWVAWEDDGVQLASGDGSTFSAVGTTGTAAGTGPSLASTADGTIVLAWRDSAGESLMFGVYGQPEGILLANPSPSPTPSLAPSADTDCGADGKLALDIVALNVLYDVNCLVGPADEPFEIDFDNQDAGVPHNVAIYTDTSAGESIFVGETFSGVAQQTYAVEPIPEGSYFFRCDFHPTTMTGTFAAVAGAK